MIIYKQRVTIIILIYRYSYIFNIIYTTFTILYRVYTTIIQNDII